MIRAAATWSTRRADSRGSDELRLPGPVIRPVVGLAFGRGHRARLPADRVAGTRSPRGALPCPPQRARTGRGRRRRFCRLAERTRRTAVAKGRCLQGTFLGFASPVTLGIFTRVLSSRADTMDSMTRAAQVRLEELLGANEAGGVVGRAVSEAGWPGRGKSAIVSLKLPCSGRRLGCALRRWAVRCDAEWLLGALPARAR